MTTSPASIQPTIAVVVPCYRSSTSLPLLAQRLSTVLEQNGYSHEIIFIDDASPDAATWEMLKSIRLLHPSTVKCFQLARNIGQHGAIQCGFSQISPSVEIVLTMDDDLQHLPEDVPALIKAVELGSDLAIGAYDRKQHERWRNFGGRIVDTALRNLFDLPAGFQLTSFRAMRRFASDEALENPSRYSYLTASLLSVTRFRTNVLVTHETRHEGKTGYSPAKSIELAANLLLSYSRWPLYLVVTLFLLSVLATLSITGWAFWRWLVASHPPEGWTSTMMMLGISNTFNLASLAVIALLTTRAHRQLVGASGHWRIAAQA